MGDDRCCHASAEEAEENYMIVLNGKGTIADVVMLADRSEQVSVSAGVLATIERASQVASVTDLSIILVCNRS